MAIETGSVISTFFIPTNQRFSQREKKVFRFFDTKREMRETIFPVTTFISSTPASSARCYWHSALREEDIAPAEKYDHR